MKAVVDTKDAATNMGIAALAPEAAAAQARRDGTPLLGCCLCSGAASAWVLPLQWSQHACDCTHALVVLTQSHAPQMPTLEELFTTAAERPDCQVSSKGRRRDPPVAHSCLASPRYSPGVPLPGLPC